MQSQFVVKEIIFFSSQKCSNFFPFCANFDFSAHANKIQYAQFQNNTLVVQKRTPSLLAVKFPHLHEEPKLSIMQSRVIFFYTCNANSEMICYKNRLPFEKEIEF